MTQEIIAVEWLRGSEDTGSEGNPSNGEAMHDRDTATPSIPEWETRRGRRYTDREGYSAINDHVIFAGRRNIVLIRKTQTVADLRLERVRPTLLKDMATSFRALEATSPDRVRLQQTAPPGGKLLGVASRRRFRPSRDVNDKMNLP